jgi:HEPN domain-containing protein
MKMIEEAKVLARQAKELSQQAVDLNQQGKYVEGHRLMQQAVEAGRKASQLINQPKIEKTLAQFEEMHQS